MSIPCRHDTWLRSSSQASGSAQSSTAQKLVGAGGILGIQRWLGRQAVVELLFVATVTIGLIDEGLQIAGDVGVAVAQGDAHGSQPLAQREPVSFILMCLPGAADTDDVSRFLWIGKGIQRPAQDAPAGPHEIDLDQVYASLAKLFFLLQIKSLSRAWSLVRLTEEFHARNYAMTRTCLHD